MQKNNITAPLAWAKAYSIKGIQVPVEKMNYAVWLQYERGLPIMIKPKADISPATRRTFQPLFTILGCRLSII